MAEVDVRTPTLVCSHLDIVYRVFGAKTRGTNSAGTDEAPALLRLLKHAPTVGNVNYVHAVKDVSFVAYSGETIGIVGRNGSGKSTLLRALAGLLPPNNGHVWIKGDAALLGVNAVLLNSLSGMRNIEIGGLAMGLTPEEVREMTPGIVDFAGIGDFVHLPMSAYSSGMGARLRFAISTAKVPEVLMIDEALATGDADFQARSAARVQEIHEQAGTVFLVSHSAGTVRKMCSRALWMDKGQLIMDGPVDEVLGAYEATTVKKK